VPNSVILDLRCVACGRASTIEFRDWQPSRPAVETHWACPECGALSQVDAVGPVVSVTRLQRANGRSVYRSGELVLACESCREYTVVGYEPTEQSLEGFWLCLSCCEANRLRTRGKITDVMRHPAVR